MSGLYWAVLRAAATVGSLSLVVKFAGVLKEGLVAYRVGTAPELDAFLLAYAFPAFMLNVMAGSLAAAFVPVYAHVRTTEGDDAAHTLAAKLTWLLLGALIALAVVMAPICDALLGFIGTRMDPEALSLARILIYALMPVLILNGLTGFWSAVLNARERFAVAALAPIATPAVTAAALVILWDQFGIYSLVIGTLAGGVLELVVLGICVYRGGLQVTQFSVRGHRSIGLVWPQFLAAAGGNVLLGATVIIDQSMAARLAPGSVAALGYGTRVTSVLLGIGSMALATALLPHLSRLVAERRFAPLRELLRRCVLLILGVAVPCTVLLMLFSELLISILFERGSFVASDSKIVSEIQIAYAIQIPFFAWAMVAARLIAALSANRFLLLGAAISLVLDVLLNWLFSIYLGVTGIALATSVVYIVSCGFLWVVVFVKLRDTMNVHLSRR